MIAYSGRTDAGFQRETNEDFLMVKEYGDDIVFAAIADGAGSVGTTFQPATIALMEVKSIIERLYHDREADLRANTELLLGEAVRTAGRVLGAFKTANEELYNGFAASASCCMVVGDTFYFAHTGNTRIHLIRKNAKTNEVVIKMLTKDQTEGQDLLDAGKCSFAEYHLMPERLMINGGLGVVADPIVQTFAMPLKENDILLLTTDGIHYAIRPDVIVEILKRSATLDESIESLILAAKTEEYADNMSALLLWHTTERANTPGGDHE